MEFVGLEPRTQRYPTLVLAAASPARSEGSAHAECPAERLGPELWLRIFTLAAR